MTTIALVCNHMTSLFLSLSLSLSYTAQNVLVFDGGRTVKLTDFGTAVAVGEATAALKGWTPYFVAPEVVKEEVPKFSADIWSVLCILVEMLTAKSPGCFHFMRPHMAMMFLVGCNIEYERERKRDMEGGEKEWRK